MVVITAALSDMSIQSSMTQNVNESFIAASRNSTKVQEGCYVFRIIKPEMIRIQRLQDLYMQETERAALENSLYVSRSRNIAHPNNRTNISVSSRFEPKYSGASVPGGVVGGGATGVPVFGKDELVSTDMIVITRRSTSLVASSNSANNSRRASTFDDTDDGVLSDTDDDIDNEGSLQILSTTTGEYDDDGTGTDIYSTSVTNDNDDEYNNCKNGTSFVNKFLRSNIMTSDTSIIHQKGCSSPSNTDRRQKNGKVNHDPILDREEIAEIRTNAPWNGSQDDSATIDDPTIVSTTYARLSDHSGWITLEVNGQEYIEQVPVEIGLYCFYVDNVPTGIVPRRHPMDDNSVALSTENCIRDIVPLKPLTKIYCDHKVIHPVTGVQFYRIQQTNSSYFPLWVHNVCHYMKTFPEEVDEDDSVEHDYDHVSTKKSERTKCTIYKLLPENKIRLGMFAYQALHGTVLRTKPDCTEGSKINSVHAIIHPNDVVVVDLIRESPLPVYGNGPFLRLHNYDVSHWLFEKKLKVPVLEPIPIYSGYWEFQIVPREGIIIPETSHSNEQALPNNPSRSPSVSGQFCGVSSTLGIHNQPLNRCLYRDEGSMAYLSIGDYIQCDRKIVQQITTQTKKYSSPSRTVVLVNNYYRAILKNGETGWIIDKQYDPTTYYTANRKGDGVKLKLLTSYEPNYEENCENSLGTSVTADDDEDTNSSVQDSYEEDVRGGNMKEKEGSSSAIDFDEDDLDEWTPEYVRDIALVVGNGNTNEVEYQPVGNVLKFETLDFITITVFCSTKTVQTAFEISIDEQLHTTTNDDADHPCDGAQHRYDDPTKSNEGNGSLPFVTYKCYRNCSVKTLTSIMKLTVADLLVSENQKGVQPDEIATREERNGKGHNGDVDNVYQCATKNDGDKCDSFQDEKKDDDDTYDIVCRLRRMNTMEPITPTICAHVEETKVGEVLSEGQYKVSTLTTGTAKSKKGKKKSNSTEQHGLGELALRNELLSCDIEIIKLLAKRQELWDTVQAYINGSYAEKQTKDKIRLSPFNSRSRMNKGKSSKQFFK